MEVINKKRDDFMFIDVRNKCNKTTVDVNNEKFRNDFDHAIELNKRIANIIGIWPIFPEDSKSSKSSIEMIVKRTKNAVIYFLLMFLFVPGILNILFEERNVKRSILKMASMIVNIMALVTFTVILMREEKIREFIKSMESDWKDVGTEELRSIMRRNAEVGRRLTRICAVTLYCAGFFYRLIKTLFSPTIYRGDLAFKPLPSPIFGGMFRFNSSASPAYETIFAVQMMGGFAVHSTTITICSYAAVLATHACGQFDIVVYFLQKLIDDDEDNGRFTGARDIAVDRNLRAIVQLHPKISHFVGDIEDLLHEICLIEVVGSTLMLCLIGYYFIMDLKQNNAVGIFTYTVMITAVSFLVFTYSYIGKLVTKKTQMVGSSAYMINWYDLPPKRGLYIGLIISVSRSPIKLTAGKMLELSMYNFGCIMKSAVGYLHLLRTMAD